MQEPEMFSHVAVPSDLFRAIHAYLGQRPAAEAARMLLALEASPACNITAPPPVDAASEAAREPGPVPDDAAA